MSNQVEISKMELVIDVREHHIIEKLTECNTIKFSTEQLDIGDIIFRQDGEIVLIIERKTVNDLKASICDGRAREQKLRLLGSGIPIEKILYLIEGNIDKNLEDKVSGLPISTLLGSLINTQMRDNIKVYKTLSLNETVNYIIKMLDKLTKDGDTYFQIKHSISQSEYASSLKKSKKSNMTPEVWFICQLTQIPQVTDKIAEVIVLKYQNLVTLIREYEKTPDHLRVKLVADLTYELSSGKSRRVGDKISEKIYNFMYGIQKKVVEKD